MANKPKKPVYEAERGDVTDVQRDPRRAPGVQSGNGGPLGQSPNPIPRPVQQPGSIAGPTGGGDDISAWIRAFVAEMSKDVGPGDPMFDSLSKLGAARSSMNVGASGVRVGRGGLGELAIQQGSMNAVQPYLMQRKQMALQGQGLLDSRDRGLESLRQGAYELNLQQTQMQNQLDMQRYMAAADAAGGEGGMWGGILGGLVGGVATAATGGAAAPLIPGLISGGSSIGASIGQGSARRPSFMNYRPYTGGGGY